MCLESSGKPDAGKLARPVWGWGRGAIPRPTPRAGPAQTAMARLDFAAWLERLPRRRRRMTEMLGAGETTQTVARRFRISPGRVSQIRRELKDCWDAFQNGTEGAKGEDTEG